MTEPEQKKMITRDFLGVKVTLVNDGTFINDEGKPQETHECVKIGAGSSYVRLTGKQFYALLTITEDTEVMTEIKSRVHKEIQKEKVIFEGL